MEFHKRATLISLLALIRGSIAIAFHQKMNGYEHNKVRMYEVFD